MATTLLERRLTKLDNEIAAITTNIEKKETELTKETARTIITFNKSPDISFDRSINPYRGCEHGCVYCFARPSHAYLGLSPGLDFETRLIAEPNAAPMLREELDRPRGEQMGQRYSNG